MGSVELEAAVEALVLGKFDDALVIARRIGREIEAAESGQDASATCVEIQSLFELDRVNEALEVVRASVDLASLSPSFAKIAVNLCAHCEDVELAREVYERWIESRRRNATNEWDTQSMEIQIAYAEKVVKKTDGPEAVRKLLLDTVEDEGARRIMEDSLSLGELPQEKPEVNLAATEQGNSSSIGLVVKRNQRGWMVHRLHDIIRHRLAQRFDLPNVIALVATIVVISLARSRFARRFISASAYSIVDTLRMSLGLHRNAFR